MPATDEALLAQSATNAGDELGIAAFPFFVDGTWNGPFESIFQTINPSEREGSGRQQPDESWQVEIAPHTHGCVLRLRERLVGRTMAGNVRHFHWCTKANSAPAAFR